MLTRKTVLNIFGYHLGLWPLRITHERLCSEIRSQNGPVNLEQEVYVIRNRREQKWLMLHNQIECNKQSKIESFERGAKRPKNPPRRCQVKEIHNGSVR